MRLDDPFRNGQSDAHSACFGRDEWLEELAGDFLWNASACVFDDDGDLAGTDQRQRSGLHQFSDVFRRLFRLPFVTNSFKCLI